jgi:AbrB family looped-hinge helix DNA binding protein
MRTTLRKVGSSVGAIIPKPILDALGAGEGDCVDVTLEDERIVLAPAHGGTRPGWAAAAKAIAAADDEPAWRGFPNNGDASLIW